MQLVSDNRGWPLSWLPGLKVLLAAALGSAGHFMWLWGRNRKGAALDDACAVSFSRHCTAQAHWFAVSLLSQPRAFAAHAHATLLSRTHQPVFSALTGQRARVWLLHSQASARLSTLQSETLLALIEPLTFLGVPFGFVRRHLAPPLGCTHAQSHAEPRTC